MMKQVKTNYRILVADETRMLPQECNGIWSEVDQVEIVPNKVVGDSWLPSSVEVMNSDVMVLEICASLENRTELLNQLKELLAPPFMMVLSQPSGPREPANGFRVAGCYHLGDQISGRKQFPA